MKKDFWTAIHQWIVPILLGLNIVYTVGVMDQRIVNNTAKLEEQRVAAQRQWDRITRNQGDREKVSERLARVEGGIDHMTRQLDRLSTMIEKRGP